jgi:hypothetical protein
VTFGPIDPADRVRLARSALVAYDGPSTLPAPAARAVRGKVVIDLDDADSIARGWAEAERVLTIRDADPELRQDIERLLPLLDDATADEIRAVLDELEPMMVLRLFFAALVEANHRGCSSGCMARSGASRAA